VLTLNRKDYFRLHWDNANLSGIVACKVNPDFAGMANRIHVAVTEAGELDGLLIRVNRPTGY
jgi:hypothetical protein